MQRQVESSEAHSRVIVARSDYGARDMQIDSTFDGATFDGLQQPTARKTPFSNRNPNARVIIEGKWKTHLDGACRSDNENCVSSGKKY